MKIPPEVKKNFNTLRRAFKAEAVCIMDAYDTVTEKPVVLICATAPDGNGNVTFTPFAVMNDGNPYERFAPPDPERKGKYMGVE